MMRALLVFGLLLVAGPALAEVRLVSANPGPQDHAFIFRENRTELTFSEPIEPQSASISIRDELDREVAAGVVETSPTAYITVRMKAAVVMGFEAGAYVVRWRVITLDSSTAEGSYSFHVQQHH